MNDYLNAKVTVNDIELSLLSHFPAASLTLDNALIRDINHPTQSDTLLYADELVLKFDFWQVFSGNYEIKHVQAHNAVLKLSVNSAGKENYIFWKKSTSNKKSDFKFNLKELHLLNAKVSYYNYLNDQHYAIATNRTSLLGNFADAEFDLNIDSELDYKKVAINGISYLKNETGSIKTKLHVSKNEKDYRITNGKVDISGLKFLVNGNYSNKTHGFCNFDLQGEGLEIHKVMTVFPSQFFERFSQYQSKGMLAFRATIKGDVTPQNTPEITSDFSISNASITEPDLGLSLSGLSFNGLFNSASQILDINDISAILLNSKINGRISVKHFQAPDLDFSLNGNLDLDDVHRFLKLGGLDYLNGHLNFNANVKGATRKGVFKTTKSTGTFTAKKVNFKVVNNPLEYSNINTTFKLNNGNATIKNCTGGIFNSDFSFNGVVKNLIPYVIANQGRLTIEADLTSNKIDLKEISRASNKANQKRSAIPQSIFPTSLALNLNTDIKSLEFGKFDATNLSGVVKIQNQVLTANNFRFNANEGTYKGNFELDGSNPNHYLLTTKTKLKNVDIKNLLNEFDNFGQTFITDANVSGKSATTMNIAVGLDNGFNILKNSLSAKVKFSIKNGELTNLSTLKEVADYLASNKLIKPFINTELLSEKIKHITFSDLENEITIRNEVIELPKMNIESSLMNIQISGRHGFNDSIKYGLNFRLREAMMKPQKDSEYGYVVDDGTGAKLFVSIGGTVNNPIFGLDKEERKLARKEKVELEKQTMKAVLKQELGLFKKDTAIHSLKVKEIADTKFEVNWEELDEDTITEPYQQNIITRKKKESKLNKLIKKLESTLPEKEAPELEIEIE